MSIAKLSDDLMKVPKLDVSGTNWVIYKDRFLWAVDARGLLHHVDGSGWEPRRPPIARKPILDGDGKEVGTEDAPDETDKQRLATYQIELKAWRQGEAIVKQQIAATIPDSLFMKIRTQGTAMDIWQALTADFQNKSRMVSVDL